MNKFKDLQEEVYNEMLATLKSYFKDFSDCIYALAIEIYSGEEYGIKICYQTLEGYTEYCNETGEDLNKYDVSDFTYINEDENIFFIKSELGRQIFVSILYHLYIDDTPLPKGPYSEFGITVKNGVLEKTELPDDFFAFLEETALYCAQKLKVSTNFISKDDDFLIYVCHEDSMYYRYPKHFIDKTVDKTQLYLIEEIVSI